MGSISFALMQAKEILPIACVTLPWQQSGGAGYVPRAQFRSEARTV